MEPDLIQKELGQRLGFGPLRFDERGVCSLEFDDRFTVTLEQDQSGESLHLYCALGQAPQDLLARLTCFAGLLEANLFGQGTGGASLCYDPESEALVVCKILVIKHLSLEALLESFELFVRVADSWHGRVQDRFWEGQEDDSGHDHPLEPGPFIRV